MRNSLKCGRVLALSASRRYSQVFEGKTKRMKLSDQVRRAIAESNLTRYRISQLTGINESGLAKFYNRRQGLSLDALDRLGEVLGLEINVADKAKTSKRKGT